jgi:hypothetical protein
MDQLCENSSWRTVFSCVRLTGAMCMSDCRDLWSIWGGTNACALHSFAWNTSVVMHKIDWDKKNVFFLMGTSMHNRTLTANLNFFKPFIQRTRPQKIQKIGVAEIFRVKNSTANHKNFVPGIRTKLIYGWMQGQEI